MLSATHVLCGPASNNWAECKLLHTDPIMNLIIKATSFSAFSFSSLINKPMAQDGSRWLNQQKPPFGPHTSAKAAWLSGSLPRSGGDTSSCISMGAASVREPTLHSWRYLKESFWTATDVRMFDDVCIPCLLVRIVGIVQKCRLLGGSDAVWTREKLLATLKRERWKVHESPAASRNPKSL